MDPIANGASVRRSGIGAAARRAHRSASNLSDSSTSSDILVAPGPPTSESRRQSAVETIGAGVMSRKRATAELRNGRLFVVKIYGDDIVFLKGLVDGEKNRREINDSRSANLDGTVAVKNEDFEGDDEGPNHRGTYSKLFTLQHPNIKWVHRGQGRYKPAGGPNGLHSLSQSGSSALNDSNLSKFGYEPSTRKPSTPRIKLSPGENTIASNNDSHQHSADRPWLGGKRHSDAQTNSTSIEQRSARLARRAKPLPTTENDRRSSRISIPQQTYNEDADDSDMDGEKEPTYNKDYVDAHPGEKFFHTGNGWYKRGERPRAHKNAKRRDSEGHAVMRRRDGSWQFDQSKTIHVTQIDNYPGVEFHHCGNGWYRPGPDFTGHRTSRIGGGEDIDDDEAGEDEDEDESEGERMAGRSVSKEYTLRHPEVNWVHRGKGRYKSLGKASRRPAPSELEESEDSGEAERDQTIYSKAYVLAHPDEEFHHRGNARYMRGPPPDHWASARRRKSAAASAATQDDDGALFSKSYVDLHPEETFHHRGQGRYARGPRPKTLPTDNEGEASDADPEALVDTDYVEAHPNETFHHRGQGRWARGMPPLGASNKVAIRGPGLYGKPDGDGATLFEDEDPANNAPPLTALVLKSDGPEKWPGVTWYYRGGGKWGRLSKQEADDLKRGTVRKPKGKGKLRNVDGPEAQLERETAAAEAARYGVDDEGFIVPGEMGMNRMPVQDKPKIKRRRMMKRGFSQQDGLVSKHSSQSQSQAPTPKPRMLAPEEDILAEEDLPQLYRDDWTPEPDHIEDEADRLLRTVYRPMNSPEKFVKALTKHDPAARPLPNLKALTANTQAALDQIQAEFLELDKVTAPHSRIPRRPVKGGRVPVDSQIFEDKKEAELYDYTYDPRRIGFQDPDAQKIQRDAEGRELRNRRNRSGAQPNGTLPGWNFGEDDTLASKRAVKPVNRFDGIVNQPRKRARNSTTATGRNSNAPSMTPDRGVTPLGGPYSSGYVVPSTGRWAGHVPKRIQELRGESAGAVSVGRETTPGGSRKGRPPGSKNLFKRKDAGIKKGPRNKPKTAGDNFESPGISDVEGESEGAA